MMAQLARSDCEALDRDDGLAGFREAFDLPSGVIYLDGNSLGALPKQALPRVLNAVSEEWGKGLIRSWNAAGWIDAPTRVGAKIARLIGAEPEEVVVADSTSVNLFKLLAGAMSLRPNRRTILTESGNFPTDLYIMRGLERLLAGRLEIKALPTEDLLEAIDEEVIAVALTHVHYKSGRRWPMAEVTRAAHAKGALALWDLSHSAGAISLGLDACSVDLAVGCGYKYLNGGPGAPSFVYVAHRHQSRIVSPLTGWMGHAQPFAFSDDYEPAPDIRAQLCGTPSVLGLAALEAGVDLMLEADIAAVERKSASLCELLIEQVHHRCPGAGLALASPRSSLERGSHVSFRHPEAYGLVQALISRGIIGDFRAPDVARFGITPLYTRYVDIFDAAEAIADVLEKGAHQDPKFSRRLKVT